MPSIRRRITAVTADALQGIKFSDIPGPNGAIINLWASAVTATDDIGLAIGDREILVAGTDINIEASADVIDTDRDQLVFNEVVPPGHLFLPVNAITTELQFLLAITYL